MVFISATRLRVKSIRDLFAFFVANEASIRRLSKTNGFLGGFELVDKNLTFWTLTMWQAGSNMLEFRNSEPHRKAMQKLPVWCDEASYVHWEQEENSLPDWKSVYAKMIADGKTTKVRNPTSNQLTKSYPEIKWTKVARRLKPAGA